MRSGREEEARQAETGRVKENGGGGRGKRWVGGVGGCVGGGCGGCGGACHSVCRG